MLTSKIKLKLPPCRKSKLVVFELQFIDINNQNLLVWNFFNSSNNSCFSKDIVRRKALLNQFRKWHYCPTEYIWYYWFLQCKHIYANYPALYGIALDCIKLHCSASYCVALHWIVMNCIILNYFILRWPTLHYTAYTALSHAGVYCSLLNLLSVKKRQQY